MLELLEILPIKYAFLIPFLNTAGYVIKHKTKLDNTLIPFILFAIALVFGIVVRGFTTNYSSMVLYWLDVVLYHGIINGIKTTIYACGGYEVVRATYFHYKSRKVETDGEKKRMSTRTKTLIVILAAFLISSAIFCAISLVFGAGLFGAFAKLTDGIIFGILLMMGYDLLSRLILRKEKITKTYVAMQILLLINVTAFAMASVTTNRTFSIIGLAIFVLSGLSAGILPYLIDYIKARRGDIVADTEKKLSASDIQSLWVKQRAKIVSASSIETKRKLLERFLAYKCVGDTIYGELDMNNPLIIHEANGTMYALSVKSALDAGYSETSTEITDARAYINKLLEEK